jgi:hypothetical protein
MRITKTNTGLALVLAAGLASPGCASKHYPEPSFAAWQDIYNNIDVRFVSDPKYSKNKTVADFRSLPEEEQGEKLNDSRLKQFKFLNRKNPSNRDIYFLHILEEHDKNQYTPSQVHF